MFIKIKNLFVLIKLLWPNKCFCSTQDPTMALKYSLCFEKENSNDLYTGSFRMNENG